jgi:hypothetical protein
LSSSENIHAIIEDEHEKEQTENAKQQPKVQPCEETKRVPLDPLVLEKQVIIGTNLT